MLKVDFSILEEISKCTDYEILLNTVSKKYFIEQMIKYKYEFFYEYDLKKNTVEKFSLDEIKENNDKKSHLIKVDNKGRFIFFKNETIKKSSEICLLIKHHHLNIHSLHRELKLLDHMNPKSIIIEIDNPENIEIDLKNLNCPKIKYSIDYSKILDGLKIKNNILGYTKGKYMKSSGCYVYSKKRD